MNEIFSEDRVFLAAWSYRRYLLKNVCSLVI